MNLVFRADGLNTGEFAFLMACCNHTDDRGYVIASMQQLADEAHMKERTARENKQRLIKRGLLATKERYSPKNGARIADLYRVNIDLLKQMQRTPRDYGPTMIEELTFATPEENSRSTPPAESAPTPPADSAPLLLPSSSPSSLSGVDGQQQESRGSVAGEREAAEPKDDNPTDSPAGVGDTSDVDKVMDAYIGAYMTTAGLPPRPDDVRSVHAGAVALLSVGRSVDSLRCLAAELGTKGWTDLVKHAQHNPEQARPAAQSKPWCGECNYGQEPMFPAARMREDDEGRMEKCHCHPGYVPKQPVHA
nr:helix-turn-helix domain-containing protein [Streptomyces sp. F2]